MKSIWLTLVVVAAIALLGVGQANTDERDKAPAPAADPMLGKEAGQVRNDNGLIMKLVWCPPGFVTMGVTESIAEVITEPATTKKVAPSDDDDVVDAPNDKPASKPNRRPTTAVAPSKVFLTKGYWLGKFEVTQSEWSQLMQTEPWKGRDETKEGIDFPATWISWNDATDFCRKLTEQERQAGRLSNDWEYTLPTESQWESACRARTETAFSFGNDESKLGEYAWFVDNTIKVGEFYPHRVGQKKSNRWGLFDMHGNVWELCRDVYAEKLPGGRDPEVKPAEKSARSDRVVQGGAWGVHAERCRSGSRGRCRPDNGDCNLGFRLALSSVR